MAYRKLLPIIMIILFSGCQNPHVTSRYDSDFVRRLMPKNSGDTIIIGDDTCTVHITN